MVLPLRAGYRGAAVWMAAARGRDFRYSSRGPFLPILEPMPLSLEASYKNIQE